MRERVQNYLNSLSCSNSHSAENRRQREQLMADLMQPQGHFTQHCDFIDFIDILNRDNSAADLRAGAKLLHEFFRRLTPHQLNGLLGRQVRGGNNQLKPNLLFMSSRYPELFTLLLERGYATDEARVAAISAVTGVASSIFLNACRHQMSMRTVISIYKRCYAHDADANRAHKELRRLVANTSSKAAQSPVHLLLQDGGSNLAASGADGRAALIQELFSIYKGRDGTTIDPDGESELLKLLKIENPQSSVKLYDHCTEGMYRAKLSAAMRSAFSPAQQARIDAAVRVGFLQKAAANVGYQPPLVAVQDVKKNRAYKRLCDDVRESNLTPAEKRARLDRYSRYNYTVLTLRWLYTGRSLREDRLDAVVDDLGLQGSSSSGGFGTVAEKKEAVFRALRQENPVSYKGIFSSWQQYPWGGDPLSQVRSRLALERRAEDLKRGALSRVEVMDLLKMYSYTTLTLDWLYNGETLIEGRLVDVVRDFGLTGAGPGGRFVSTEAMKRAVFERLREESQQFSASSFIDDYQSFFYQPLSPGAPAKPRDPLPTLSNAAASGPWRSSRVSTSDASNARRAQRFGRSKSLGSQLQSIRNTVETIRRAIADELRQRDEVRALWFDGPNALKHSCQSQFDLVQAADDRKVELDKCSVLLRKINKHIAKYDEESESLEDLLQASGALREEYGALVNQASLLNILTDDEAQAAESANSQAGAYQPFVELPSNLGVKLEHESMAQILATLKSRAASSSASTRAKSSSAVSGKQPPSISGKDPLRYMMSVSATGGSHSVVTDCLNQLYCDDNAILVGPSRKIVMRLVGRFCLGGAGGWGSEDGPRRALFDRLRSQDPQVFDQFMRDLGPRKQALLSQQAVLHAQLESRLPSSSISCQRQQQLSAAAGSREGVRGVKEEPVASLSRTTTATASSTKAMLAVGRVKKEPVASLSRTTTTTASSTKAMLAVGRVKKEPVASLRTATATAATSELEQGGREAIRKQVLAAANRRKMAARAAAKAAAKAKASDSEQYVAADDSRKRKPDDEANRPLSGSSPTGSASSVAALLRHSLVAGSNPPAMRANTKRAKKADGVKNAKQPGHNDTDKPSP